MTPSSRPPEVRRGDDLARELLTVVLHDHAVGTGPRPSEEFNIVMDEIHAGGLTLAVRTLSAMALIAEMAIGLLAEGREESPEETWQWLARPYYL